MKPSLACSMNAPLIAGSAWVVFKKDDSTFFVIGIQVEGIQEVRKGIERWSEIRLISMNVDREYT